MRLINSVAKFNIHTYKYYFIDTNIWIAFLRYTLLSDSNEKVTPYINFIESIIAHNESINSLPTKIRKKGILIKIIFSNTLLSEIINTSLREICMKQYFQNIEKNYKNYNFKDDYRNNINSDFTNQLSILIDDIKSYKEHILQIDDYFTTTEYPTLLDKINTNMDYNDMYYEHIIQNSNLDICLITDDGDFAASSFPILSLNKKLLQKA